MSTQFAIDLVRQNILSADHCLAVIEVQIARQIRFGALAIRENLMTMKQVAEVLDAQSRESGPKQFGELAVEMGFLTQTAIDHLAVAQISTRPKLRQLLVEMNLLNKSECEALFRNFQRRNASTSKFETTALRRPKFRSKFKAKTSLASSGSSSGSK